MLKESIKIKNLLVHNRLVMPPMATAKATEAGGVTKELCDYYAEKSQGGAIGLVITEHSFVSLTGKASENQLSIAREEDITGLKKLVSTIHQNDSKVFAQINHAGAFAVENRTGAARLSASSVPMPKLRNAGSLPPKEMTLPDIHAVVQEFALSANLRMEKAVSLLEQGDLSVRAISEQLGFNDPRSFTRLFKKCYGINPMDYRKGKN